MKKNLKTAVLLLVVALLALPMYAQPGRGQRPDGQRSGMGQRPGMGQGMQFSEEDMKDRISSLADTLKLSESQEKQILDVELKFVRTMQSQRQNFNFESSDREAFRDKMTQLRDERDAKYKSKPFKRLLHKISLEPAKVQAELLDSEHVAWQGDTEQVDDILILGMRYTTK